jgi:hypothetical protein
LGAGIRDGSVFRVDRGAYAPRSDAATNAAGRYRLRVEAAARRSPQLALSHTSAASVYRVPVWGVRLQRVHQIRPGAGGSSKTDRRWVHVGRLDPADIVTVDGMPVTSPARTLVDLARIVPFQTAVIAADNALNREIVTPAELASALDRAAHLPGVGAARRALLFADGRSESVGESRTRLLLHSCGLPEPELQIEVFADGVFVGRGDLGYVDCGVLIEFDGETKYGQLLAPGVSPTDAVLKEKYREDDIRRVGVVVVRVTWHELQDRALVRSRVLAAIEQGRKVVAWGGLTGRLVPRPPVRIGR